MVQLIELPIFEKPLHIRSRDALNGPEIPLTPYQRNTIGEAEEFPICDGRGKGRNS